MSQDSSKNSSSSVSSYDPFDAINIHLDTEESRPLTGIISAIFIKF